jgi:hypothetical protein
MKNKYLKTLLLLILQSALYAQNYPTLLIDNVNTQFSDISFPYWLKAGQTINVGTSAKSVSILEFNVNGNSLEFTQAIILISSQTVPANKVWKIEAIGMTEQNSSLPFLTQGSSVSSSTDTNVPTIFQSPRKFETPGTYNWIVPPGVNKIYIEVWAAGGGGGAAYNGNPASGGGGGGAGGYSYAWFTVVPGNAYTVTVGSGGSFGIGQGNFGANGGGSSVGNLIIALGGNGGAPATVNSGGAGGTGGTGNYANGANGDSGGFECFCSGNGGSSILGQHPAIGAGGAGSNTSANNSIAQNGVRGQVYIYW